MHLTNNYVHNVNSLLQFISHQSHGLTQQDFCQHSKNVQHELKHVKHLN